MGDTFNLRVTAVSYAFQNISTITTVTIDIELRTDIIADVYSSDVDPHNIGADQGSTITMMRIRI
jgi:hypothetical protein